MSYYTTQLFNNDLYGKEKELKYEHKTNFSDSRQSSVENNLQPSARKNFVLPETQVIRGTRLKQMKPLGLPNSKHFCFINSVVQCLRHCPDFVNKLLIYFSSVNSDQKLKGTKKEVQLINKFGKIIKDLSFYEEALIDGSSTQFQKIHEEFPEFAEGEHDADEYMLFLLNKLNDVTKKSKLKRIRRASGIGCRKAKVIDSETTFLRYTYENNSLVTELFCGQMDSQIYCQKCEWRKSSYQVFIVLSVPVAELENNEIKITDCLDAFKRSQKLDIDKCPHCHRSGSVYTATEITNWPKYLIIHIKRQLRQNSTDVNSTAVQFNIHEKLCLDKSPTYSLYGVIDHLGSVHSGHYFAKCQDMEDTSIWWCLNDTVVTRLDKPECQVVTGRTVTYLFKS